MRSDRFACDASCHEVKLMKESRCREAGSRPRSRLFIFHDPAMSQPINTEQNRPVINWMDVLWLLFLAGLAALPPVAEIHKQLTLLAIGIVQFSEGWFLARVPRRG